VRYSIFSVVDHYPDRLRSVGEFYRQILDEIALAERLGFDNYFLAEHHFHEYGVVPSPPVLLAAAAERTSRIGLGTAVAVLPFHEPVRLAEECAMLDQLSGGRVALGVGSGYLAHEFAGFGIAPQEKRARFDEALAVLERALSGERFSHHGRYFHYEDARLNVPPVQRPLPLWVAILNNEAAYHVGRAGRNVMMVPYAQFDDLGQLAEVVAAYRRGRADGGHDPDGGDVAVTLHAYVAESDVAACAGAAVPLQNYVESRLYARRRTLEELDGKGLVLFGGAETVAGRVAAAARAGMTRLMLLANFGAMPAQQVNESLSRFMAEVPARVDAQLREPQAATADGDA